MTNDYSDRSIDIRTTKKKERQISYDNREKSLIDMYFYLYRNEQNVLEKILSTHFLIFVENLPVSK